MEWPLQAYTPNGVAITSTVLTPESIQLHVHVWRTAKDRVVIGHCGLKMGIVIGRWGGGGGGGGGGSWDCSLEI